MPVSEPAPVMNPEDVIADLTQSHCFPIANKNPLHPQVLILFDLSKPFPCFTGGTKLTVGRDNQIRTLPAAFLEIIEGLLDGFGNIGSAVKAAGQKSGNPGDTGDIHWQIKSL